MADLKEIPEKKRMDVRRLNDSTDHAVDARANGKFGDGTTPGRVMNCELETDGKGTSEIVFRHPDGSTEVLSRVPVPKLEEREKLRLYIRVAAGTYTENVPEPIEREIV